MTEMNQYDVRLCRGGPAFEIHEDLVRPPARVPFVVLIEIVVP